MFNGCKTKIGDRHNQPYELFNGKDLVCDLSERWVTGGTDEGDKTKRNIAKKTER